MNRRTLLSASAVTLGMALTGCTGSTASSQVSLDQVKAYLDAGVLALEAAAQQFEAGPPPPSAANLALVQQIAASLETSKASLDTITVPADYKTGLLEAVALMQQLSPLVGSFLGAAGPYLPLVFAVAQAFVASLPPPADAPPTPPAALARKGLEYRKRH